MKSLHTESAWNVLTCGDMGRDAIAELRCHECGCGLLKGEESISEVHSPNHEALERLASAGKSYSEEDNFCAECRFKLERITR